MLQFLNTEGNRPRNEAYMGFKNGNPFFGANYRRCGSGVENVGNCLPRICRGVEGVVGEVKSVSWGGARTKGKGRECELTKNMFLHSDLLKLCVKKKREDQ